MNDNKKIEKELVNILSILQEQGCIHPFFWLGDASKQVLKHFQNLYKTLKPLYDDKSVEIFIQIYMNVNSVVYVCNQKMA